VISVDRYVEYGAVMKVKSAYCEVYIVSDLVGSCRAVILWLNENHYMFCISVCPVSIKQFHYFLDHSSH